MFFVGGGDDDDVDVTDSSVSSFGFTDVVKDGGSSWSDINAADVVVPVVGVIVNVASSYDGGNSYSGTKAVKLFFCTGWRSVGIIERF